MQTHGRITQSTSQPGRGTDGIRTSVASQLSMPLISLVGSAFVSGVSYGFFQFLNRSHIRQEHVAGSAAWLPQLCVLLAAAVILSVAQVQHQRRVGSGSGRLWLLAPVGQQAARRVARALGLGSDKAQPLRLLLTLPAAALFLFCFWRAGAQVTGGFDPNFTVNAWGGPTYAGALACHYLDLFLVAAGAAWLMDRTLPA